MPAPKEKPPGGGPAVDRAIKNEQAPFDPLMPEGFAEPEKAEPEKAPLNR
jgi:hypothetical protein